MNLLPFSIGGGLPAAGFVFEDHAFEQAENNLFFFGIAADSLKLQSQVIIRAALVLTKH